MSIHTSQGFSGYTSPSCASPLPLFRFLGPTVYVAIAFTLLWTSSVMLHLVVFVFCLGSLLVSSQTTVIASVLMLIAVMSLAAISLVLRIDYCYDPDSPGVALEAGHAVPTISVVSLGPDLPGRVAWQV